MYACLRFSQLAVFLEQAPRSAEYSILKTLIDNRTQRVDSLKARPVSDRSRAISAFSDATSRPLSPLFYPNFAMSDSDNIEIAVSVLVDPSSLRMSMLGWSASYSTSGCALGACCVPVRS